MAAHSPQLHLCQKRANCHKVGAHVHILDCMMSGWAAGAVANVHVSHDEEKPLQLHVSKYLDHCTPSLHSCMHVRRSLKPQGP